MATKPTRSVLSASAPATTSVSLTLVRESRSTVSESWNRDEAIDSPDLFSRDFFAEYNRRASARLLPAQTEADLRKVRGRMLRGWDSEGADIGKAMRNDSDARKWASDAFDFLASLPRGVLSTPIHPATEDSAAFTLRDAAGLLFSLPTTSETRKGGKGGKGAE